MHTSPSKRPATGIPSKCHSSPALTAHRGSRRSPTTHTVLASALVTLLVACTLLPSATAKCCISIDARSDSLAPQSFTLKVGGRATTFFPNNKKYDIQAVFPTNYALQAPKPVLPLTKPNCTQFVAPPNNNPNGFRCSYETTNPEVPTSFFIEWKVIVPPPANPDTPQPKPEFLEFWVNGDMKCDQEPSVDNCPDPATGKPTNATSAARLGRTVGMVGLTDGGAVGAWIGLVSLVLAVGGGLIV